VRYRRYMSVLVVAILVISVVGALTPGATTGNHDRDIVLVRDVGENEDVSVFEEVGEVLDRYGRYLLLEAPEDEIEGLRGLYQIDHLEERNQLNIKGHEFETNEGYPEFDSDLMIDEYEEGEEGIYIVDMIAPVNPEWREELEDLGVEVINYQRNYAYEVVMTPEQVDEVEDLDFVDWVGIYQPGFKLAENLEPGEITVSYIDGRTDIVTVDHMSQIVSLANREDVYYISQYSEAELHAEIDSQLVGGGAWFMDDYSDWNPDLDPPPREGDPMEPYRKHGDHGAFINQQGYTGDGVTIAIADSGLYSDAERNFHEDFQERVVGGVYYDSDEEEWKDENWYQDTHPQQHGTHVTGLAAGNTADGTADTMEFADYYKAQGLAYDSEIFVTRAFDGATTTPEEFYSIVEEPAQRSYSYIHCNSWGRQEDEDGYEEAAVEYDKAVRDANSSSSENEPMVITASAGNNDVDNSIESPGIAKNVITVGASMTFKGNGSYPESIAGFSSGGWTDDNRVKPDVVAPGAWNIPSTSDVSGYRELYGTSMANPIVAGAAAVVVEWYEDNFNEKPSPAMVKSILINTANDLEDTRGPIPNRDEGWGIPDLSKLEHEDSPGFYFEDQTSLLETGDKDIYTIEPEDGDEPLKISLVWTDKEAGNGDHPTLKNDLNLEVINPDDEEIRGNAFDESGDGESNDGYTYPNAEVIDDFDGSEDGWDDRNNVQNVYIHPDEVEEGETYIIKIHGYDIVADANNDGEENQDYALVVQNAEELNEAYSLTVDSVGGGDTVPKEGTYYHSFGTKENLSADPDWGYEFAYWLVDGEEYYDRDITVTMDDHKHASAYFVPEGGGVPTSLNSSYAQYLDEGPMAAELAKAFRDEDLSLPDAKEEAILSEKNYEMWNVLVDDEGKYLIVEREKELMVYSY